VEVRADVIEQIGRIDLAGIPSLATDAPFAVERNQALCLYPEHLRCGDVAVFEDNGVLTHSVGEGAPVSKRIPVVE